jgi:hypothetical protein
LAGYREVSEETALFRSFGRQPPSALKEQVQQYVQQSNIQMPVLAQLVDVLDQPSTVCEKLRGAYDPASHDGTRLFKIGLWAAQFGDTELALTAMRRAFVELHAMPVQLLWLPSCRALRQDPRFKDLLRDLNIVKWWRESGKWGDFARPLGDDDFEITQ